MSHQGRPLIGLACPMRVVVNKIRGACACVEVVMEDSDLLTGGLVSKLSSFFSVLVYWFY